VQILLTEVLIAFRSMLSVTVFAKCMHFSKRPLKIVQTYTTAVNHGDT